MYWGLYAGIHHIHTCLVFCHRKLTTIVVNKQGILPVWRLSHCVYSPPLLSFMDADCRFFVVTFQNPYLLIYVLPLWRINVLIYFGFGFFSAVKDAFVRFINWLTFNSQVYIIMCYIIIIDCFAVLRHLVYACCLHC